MKKLRFSDGILLAIIPAAGYLVAYMYELGYCRYFNIPYDFIAVDKQVIVSSVLAVLGLFAAIHPLIDFVREHFAWVPKPIARILMRNILVIAIIVSLSVVSRAKYPQMILLCAAFAGPSVLENLLLPIFPAGSSASYVERVALQLSKGDARQSMFDIYAKAAGVNATMLAVLIYLICLSAYIVGGYTAKSKVRFLTVAGSSEVVLIRSNSEFLAATYDPARRNITPDLRLVSIDSKLRIADIGPLIPALPPDPRSK